MTGGRTGQFRQVLQLSKTLRLVYTHSPALIRGSAAPDAVIPSMSSLSDPIIQST